MGKVDVTDWVTGMASRSNLSGRHFKAGFKKAGLEGVVPHDMRRSAIRNFTKVGLGESEGMSISGHKTNDVYKRYNIIDENLQRQSLERVQQHQRREIEEGKVIPIRQAR